MFCYPFSNKLRSSGALLTLWVFSLACSVAKETKQEKNGKQGQALNQEPKPTSTPIPTNASNSAMAEPSTTPSPNPINEPVATPLPVPSVAASVTPVPTIVADFPGNSFRSLNQRIFQSKCVTCHSDTGRAHRVPLTSYDEIMNSPRDLIVPGVVEESGIFIAVERDDDKRMPPKTSSIGAVMPAELEDLRSWIEAGAQNN